MKGKSSFYEIDFGECYCYCRDFTINGIDADYEDFGVKYDRDEENAEEYCCGNMQFTRHVDEKKINACTKKYGITRDQFHEVAAVLEKGLSFGSCGWCS